MNEILKDASPDQQDTNLEQRLRRQYAEGGKNMLRKLLRLGYREAVLRILEDELA